MKPFSAKQSWCFWQSPMGQTGSLCWTGADTLTHPSWTRGWFNFRHRSIYLRNWFCAAARQLSRMLLLCRDCEAERNNNRCVWVCVCRTFNLWFAARRCPTLEENTETERDDLEINVNARGSNVTIWSEQLWLINDFICCLELQVPERYCCVWIMRDLL